MPIELIPAVRSPRVTYGRESAAEFRYTARGSAVFTEIYQHVLAATPASVDLWGGGVLAVPRDRIELDAIGEDVWAVAVFYNSVAAPGDVDFEFETGGGTQHITTALATVGSYTAAGVQGPAPDMKNAIGYTKEGNEGADVPVPSACFSENKYFSDAQVTEAYQKRVADLTARVNSQPFRSYPAGEVLFLGARGSRNRATGVWTVNFRFSRVPNMTNETIGPFTGVTKRGQDYFWSMLVDDVDPVTKWPIRRPAHAYVNEVLRYADLNLLEP